MGGLQVLRDKTKACLHVGRNDTLFKVTLKFPPRTGENNNLTHVDSHYRPLQCPSFRGLTTPLHVADRTWSLLQSTGASRGSRPFDSVNTESVTALATGSLTPTDTSALG